MYNNKYNHLHKLSLPGLDYIQKEDPDILKLRIEIMIKENCEEFALNLCEWSLKHPALRDDLKIKENQIFILYKQAEYSKMLEVASSHQMLSYVVLYYCNSSEN